MAISEGYLAYVLDQLEGLGEVTPRKMFGGAGLYSRGLFFGLIADDVLYLKVDDTNRSDYEQAGMPAFNPFGTYSMGYYQVPPDVLEDGSKLRKWAEKAVKVAMSKSRGGGGKKARERRKK